MMTAVRARAELYDEWASTVTETLEAKLEKKKGTQQEHIRKQGLGQLKNRMSLEIPSRASFACFLFPE